ncbi:MAG: hypothetical protein NTZ33_14310 [Bacteroidetes bacterium]|nr:hypothetical protein [Bacteroidota bacterium]
MNLIKDQLSILNEAEFRPKKWVQLVQSLLVNKGMDYSENSIRSVLRGEFYNEVIALEIISVFKKEQKRQAKLLKSI